MTLEQIALRLARIEQIATHRYGRKLHEILDDVWQEVAQLRVDLEIADRRAQESRRVEAGHVSMEG